MFSRTQFITALSLFLICLQARAENDETQAPIDSPEVSLARRLFSGFSFRPGIGTTFVDVWITRKSDGYEAMLTDSHNSIGTPYLAFSITSPEYYFFRKTFTTPTGASVNSNWGIGVRSEVYKFDLNHQTLAQNKNYTPENIGTSVTGMMSYVAPMMMARFYFDSNSEYVATHIPNSIGVGLGYAKGLIRMSGNATFGPGRNTTGITTKSDVGVSTDTATGVVFVIEGEHAKKYLWGFELGVMNYQTGQYTYQLSGANFYFSYFFRL